MSDVAYHPLCSTSAYVPIHWKRLTPTAIPPVRATDGAAGWDLYMDPHCAPLVIEPGEMHCISTGIAVEIPPGMGGFVFPRSGLARKHQLHLANGVGVIDPDYRGELVVMLEMTGVSSEELRVGSDARFHIIEPGSRVAQLVLLPLPPVKLVEVDDLSETERGEGGFGSTGVS